MLNPSRRRTRRRRSHAIGLAGLLATLAAAAAAPVSAQSTAPAAPAKPVAPAPAAKRTVTLKPTKPGDYLYWRTVGLGGGATRVDGSILMLSPSQTSATLALDPKTAEIQVLNVADQTLAVIPASTAKIKNGATIAVTAADFTRVRTFAVLVAAEGGKPVSQAVVTLRDTAGAIAQRVVTPQSNGRAEFGNVRIGPATISATTGDAAGLKTSKEIAVAPGDGGAIPEANLVLTGKNIPTTTPANSTQPTKTEPKPSSATPTPATPSPVAPANTAAKSPEPAAPAPSRETPRQDWVAGIIGIAILGGGLFWGWRYAQNRGMTVPETLKKIGVEMPQDAIESADASLKNPAISTEPPLPPLHDLPPAGPSSAAGVASPASPPPPPTPDPTPAPTTASAGPRLVGVAGPVLGSVFQISSAAGAPTTIGRDVANHVSLAEDTTVSRRHARVERRGDDFYLIDAGSSNGTFVNGIRTAEAPLRSGDEIQFGIARFRFEA